MSKDRRLENKPKEEKITPFRQSASELRASHLQNPPWDVTERTGNKEPCFSHSVLPLVLLLVESNFCLSYSCMSLKSHHE